MIRILATLNPLTLALKLARRTTQHLFTAVRWKLLLTTALTLTAALVALAGIYTLTEPLNAARQIAASLRGGAPNMPAQRAECVSASTAIIDGQYSPQAQQIIAAIPPDATITTATAYLLYRLSHQDQPWQPTWEEWQNYLRDHAIAPTASDIDIAQTVDPQTDYTPYLVPARATAIDLAIGGPVTASKKQIASLANQIYTDCRHADEQRKFHLSDERTR